MQKEDRVREHFESSIAIKQAAAGALPAAIAASSELIVRSLLGNGKVLSCGNGGSAGDAQHFSSEMLNRFEMERPGCLRSGHDVLETAEQLAAVLVVLRAVLPQRDAPAAG